MDKVEVHDAYDIDPHWHSYYEQIKKINETKHVTKDTWFCNRSMIQYKYRVCKEDRVGHKTCVNPSIT